MNSAARNIFSTCMAELRTSGANTARTFGHVTGSKNSSFMGGVIDYLLGGGGN